jgi:hypothetical protein
MAGNYRSGMGRRNEDQDKVRRIEMHPVAISLVGSVLALLLTVIGYMAKGWAENLSTEIHLLRQSVEKQSQDSSANAQWRDDMGRWRDGVDRHLHDIDDKITTVPWHDKHNKNRDQGFLRKPNSDAKIEPDLSDALEPAS